MQHQQAEHRLTRRCYDAAALNRVCNHAEVLPNIGLGLSEVDLTSLVEDRRNVAFLGEYGGAIFHRSAPRVYDAHDFFLPEGRGKWALAASREMLSCIFGEHAARLVWAETPVENRACRMFNRWLGFKSEGISSVALVGGAEPRLVETFVMEAR